jgi:DNA-binding response OmpR family regulator/anti-sigma regulatory factor (Ser/Thr protein kinase)
MSHELRTPLNAILGFSELLSDERYGTLTERQRRYLDHIHTGGGHLLRLINDILDLSRIEAGRMELAIESLRVDHAFGEVVSAVRPLAEKKSQSLGMEAHDGLVVHADATRLRQVLLNLVGNAIKFTPEGGRVTLAARAENGGVRIEVRDTGPGISAEDQQRIFEAFVRLAQAGGAKEGSGLGLAITKRLVELQGGELGIESTPGHGACFHFTLPAATGVPLPAVQEPGRRLPRTGPLIVIIEDDQVAAHIIESHLRAAGYRTQICTEPQCAVETVVEARPAAVTLDIIMQPVNGWEILVQLKNDARTACIPIAVVTILDQRGMGATLGADEFLVKPVEKGALIGAISRCLRKRGRQEMSGPVLVVEDDAPTREVLSDLLVEHGYAVAVAADGEEARRWVAATIPELVVLDLLLPKVSGFDLLAEWRGDPRTSSLPIFVLTGKDLSRAEHDFLRQHSEMLLSKKLSWQQDLLEQLRRAFAADRSPE